MELLFKRAKFILNFVFIYWIYVVQLPYIEKDAGRALTLSWNSEELMQVIVNNKQSVLGNLAMDKT